MTALTEVQAKAAVDSYFITSWTNGIYFDLENVGTTEPAPGTPWVRVRLMALDSLQETLGLPGNRQYRRDAEVWCWCRVPAGTGTALVSSMIDALRNIFEGKTFNGIQPRGAVRTVTRGALGQWYEVVVIAPVLYTETR